MRRLGASRILAVNVEASGGPTTIVQPANLQPLLNRIVSLESTLQKAMASMRPITVQVTRGNESSRPAPCRSRTADTAMGHEP